MTFQKEITLGPYKRGFHIITNQIINELPVMSGIVNVFVKHNDDNECNIVFNTVNARIFNPLLTLTNV